ncbi:MAG: galactose mutarotase [Candidatus Eremiobacteraeota bacterium]|nr:galactose mutarotase [Candidatus Eremiobacteraeota bacterium]
MEYPRTPEAQFLFGTLPDGQEVTACALHSDTIRAVVLSYGATLARLEVPDRDGVIQNVVLGYADLHGYVHGTDYFGATIGRFANRLAGGRFFLDGREYHVPCNAGPNALHGGNVGFDRAVWSIEQCDLNSVSLRHVSPNGDEGFPGTLVVDVRFSVHASDIRIDYRAASDAATVVNLTNHTYFNLGGEGTGSVMDHELLLRSSAFTPVDKTLIPTGEIRPVNGTPFDFRDARRIGARIRDDDLQLRFGRGYDLHWVLDERKRALEEPAGWLYERRRGRFLEFFTTEPGIQIYSGNSLDGSQSGASGQAYRQGDGITLETQHFPDSPNRPEFPSTVLRPGETFQSTTIFRLGVR